MPGEDAVHDSAREEERPQETPEPARGAPMSESERYPAPIFIPENPSDEPRQPPRKRLTFQEDCARLGKSIWTHNPFYAISAFLVLYGLKITFTEAAASSWWLLALLVGYTSLMAAAGFGVVKLGKVWEDARTILLICVLLLLAISVSFDEIGIKDPIPGIKLLLVGMACAITLSEGLLRGMGIRLRAKFRIPYYAILSLFFLYPIIPMFLKHLNPHMAQSASWWVILSFPTVAAIAFLSLVPAAQRGKRYVRNNGTPWKWPWFPWILFGLLWLGVCVRTYLLSLSLYWVKGMDTPFGLYFLIPMVLSAAVLILEAGRARRNQAVQTFALFTAFAAIIFSFPGTGGSQVYRDFLSLVVLPKFGSPVTIATFGVILFCLYAWLRGVRYAETGLIASCIVATFASGATVNLDTLGSPTVLPLLVIGLAEAWQASRKGSSLRASVSLLSLVSALTIALKGTGFTYAYGAIPLHIILIGMIAIGCYFKSRYAKCLRVMSAVAIAVLPAILFFLPQSVVPGLPLWGRFAYASAMTALPLSAWLITREKAFKEATIINASACSLALCILGYNALRQPARPRGLVPLFWGALCFVIAVVISLLKGGVIQRGIKHFRQKETSECKSVS